MGFKTLMDIDLVLSLSKGAAVMPLRKMYGEESLSLFKEIHLLHLININSEKGVARFSEDFKEFLAAEAGMSVRKVSYVISTLSRDGYFVKEKKNYVLQSSFKELFKSRELKYPIEGYESKTNQNERDQD